MWEKVIEQACGIAKDAALTQVYSWRRNLSESAAKNFEIMHRVTLPDQLWSAKYQLESERALLPIVV